VAVVRALFAESDEHKLRVRRAAAGGRALVYVHGLGESSRCFEELAAHPVLAGRRHVLVDLPGYGRSPRPAPARSLTELADLVAGWLGAREPGATLVGHSMGGVIGTILCERHPGALGAFVNVEGTVSPGDCTFSALAAVQQREAFAAGGFDRLREVVRERGAADRALLGAHASMILADARAYHAHACELVALSADESMAARLAAIAARTPTLYVAGVPGGAAARTLELLDAHAIATARIEPAGHWPFVDQLDAVAEAIHAFAARV
jgi:pimeloyl-ACP methyl ester carboxylesterase